MSKTLLGIVAVGVAVAFTLNAADEPKQKFESVMKQAGRPCKLVGYDGAGHGFFNRGEDYAKTLAEADSFLVDLGWIKK